MLQVIAEINGWQLVGIFIVLVAMAVAGYGTGIIHGADRVERHLQDLGIVAAENENLITVYDPENDKVVVEIRWNKESVDLVQYEVDDQEWQSETEQV